MGRHCRKFHKTMSLTEIAPIAPPNHAIHNWRSGEEITPYLSLILSMWLMSDLSIDPMLSTLACVIVDNCALEWALRKCMRVISDRKYTSIDFVADEHAESDISSISSVGSEFKQYLLTGIVSRRLVRAIVNSGEWFWVCIVSWCISRFISQCLKRVKIDVKVRRVLNRRQRSDRFSAD